MRFTLKNVNDASFVRQGLISNITRLPGVELETPLLLLYTKGGSVPHISREVLDLLIQEGQVIHIPLPSTLQCFEGAKSFGKGISKFVGLEGLVSYCSVQDPAVKTKSGYNLKKAVSIWSNAGRVSLTVDKYMEVMESFQPDFYQALANGDTDIDSGKKKLKKVMESTNDLIDACLEKHKKSVILKSKGIFGSIEGGFDIEARKLSAQLVSSKAVDGFIINGFHNNGPEVESMNIHELVPVLDAVLSHLPVNKPRMIHGCWSPGAILKMIQMGIDIFDSSLAYVVGERKCALVFKYHELLKDSHETKIPNEEILYEICLTDKEFKEDFRPILEGCTCVTCVKHTRAYIHHLEDNNELLARILLIMHNLHHYMQFFKDIRSAASRGNTISIL